MAPDPEKNVLPPQDAITPVESGTTRTADSDGINKPPTHPVNEDKLRRALSPRQVQMIAIGGTIG